MSVRAATLDRATPLRRHGGVGLAEAARLAAAQSGQNQSPLGTLASGGSRQFWWKVRVQPYSRCRLHTMATLWLYYGYTMVVLWLYYGYAMAMLWLCLVEGARAAVAVAKQKLAGVNKY